MLAPDATTEIFFSPEIAFMNWRSENPELFTLIFVLFLALVAALYMYWHLIARERKITAMRIARERARREREAHKMNGGI